MAELMLLGDVARVQLTADIETAQVIATCVAHWGERSCNWTQRYGSTDDAWRYAAVHADTGRQ